MAQFSPAVFPSAAPSVVSMDLSWLGKSPMQTKFQSLYAAMMKSSRAYRLPEAKRTHSLSESNPDAAYCYYNDGGSKRFAAGHRQTQQKVSATLPAFVGATLRSVSSAVSRGVCSGVLYLLTHNNVASICWRLGCH